MSTIVCIKDANVLVLGTDSRCMTTDNSGVKSDAERKIHEIAPGVFLACTGRVTMGRSQLRRARELAAESGAADIKIFGEALGRETCTLLLDYIATYGLPQYPGRAPGEGPIYGCVLVGSAATGEPGYICHMYYYRDGRVVVEPLEFLGNEGFLITGGDKIEHVWRDPESWRDGPVKAAGRFLAAMGKADPYVGGPDQVVMLDRSGVHWIRRPPETPAAVMPETAVAVIPGKLIVGSVPNASNVPATGVGVGTLPVGVVYTGTVLCSQLGSGTLPVGVVYAGKVDCDQLNAGTIAAAISLTSPTITSTAGTNTASLRDGYLEASSPSWRAQMLAGVLNFTATSAGQPASTHTSTYSAWLDGFGFTAASIGNTGVRVNASGVNRISLTDSAANFTNCPVQIGGVTAIDSSRNGSFASVASAGNVSGRDLVASGWVYIGSTPVLKGQGSAVTDPSGGTTVDNECRAQLSSLLAQLRGVGVIR